MNWLPLGAVEPIEFFATDGTGAPITGMADLKAAVRRQSDGKWLDFDDGTFKSSGWGTQQQTMTEYQAGIAPGFYRFTLDTSSFGTADTYVIVIQEVPATLYLYTSLTEIRVGGTVPTAGIADAVLAASVAGRAAGSLGATVNRVRQHWENRLETASGSSGNHVLYDDDDVTPLLTFDVKDVAGGAVTIPAGIPTRRSRGI